jgi:hypothetical protein
MRRAIALIVLLTFATGCKTVMVQTPNYSMIAPDGECSQKCIAERFPREDEFANCLSYCQGAVRHDGLACKDAIPRAGMICGTTWNRREEAQLATGGIVAISVIAGAIVTGLTLMFIGAGLAS